MLTIRASPTGAAIDDRRKEDLLILTIITVSRPGTNDDSIDVSILIMSIPTCFTSSISIYRSYDRMAIDEASVVSISKIHVSSKRFHFPRSEN